MSWLNTAMNTGLRLLTARAMKKHEVYPAAKTALLLVDVHAGALAGTPLVPHLEHLVSAMREVGAPIIYSMYDASAEPRFPTTAHKQLMATLHGEGAADPPPSLFPTEGDIVLPRRVALSAMFQTGVPELLASREIEHIVLAGPFPLTTLDSTMRDAAQEDIHVTIIDLWAETDTPPNMASLTQLKHTMPRYAQTVWALPRFLKNLEKSNA